jgi:Arc/MetJ-type ribon-helix-helix transcriptional regulator
MIPRLRILDRRRRRAQAVKMKNITVSVPDEVYHRARVRAAELRTSVSALVRRQLEELAGEESEFERLRRAEGEIRAGLAAAGRGLRSGENVSREELHGRDAVY